MTDKVQDEKQAKERAMLKESRDRLRYAGVPRDTLEEWSDHDVAIGLEAIMLHAIESENLIPTFRSAPNSVMFVGAEHRCYQVDRDEFDASTMSVRDREVGIALLQLAADKLRDGRGEPT